MGLHCLLTGITLLFCFFLCEYYLPVNVSAVTLYFTSPCHVHLIRLALINVIFFNYQSGAFGTAATTGLLYQPRVIGDGDCGEIGGMNIIKGNRSARRKPAPTPLCPPQIPLINVTKANKLSEFSSWLPTFQCAFRVCCGGLKFWPRTYSCGNFFFNCNTFETDM
jgi:hypothetical protein